MKSSKNSDIINVELLRVCAAKFIDPDNFQEKLEEFDFIANFFRKRFYYVIYFSLFMTAIPLVFIVYYSSLVSNSMYYAIEMSELYILLYAIPYFLLNFYIQWHLSFSNSFLSRRIYNFEIPERLTVFFNLLKTEQIRVYPQWMKPRTNQSALRAIFGEGGVTLEPHLTGEAFRSRLLPLLLSSRKSDWGFCAIKGWRSFRQAPLYVQFNEEQNKSIENTDDIEDNIIFTPLKIEYDPIDVAKSLEPNYGHWRHVVLPEDYDYFLDLLLNNIGWTGEKRKILSVAITSILRDASDIKRRGAGAETITKLSNVAVDALVVQKSQNTIRDIWFGYEDLKEAKRKAESGLKDILGSGKATKISQKRNAALIEYIHFRISKNR